MKKPTFNRQKLKDAMVALKLADVRQLAGTAAPDELHAVALVDALEECGATLVRYPNANREKARQQLVDFARVYAAAFPKPLKKLEYLVTFTGVIEVYFRDILISVAAAGISQRPAAGRIWSTIEHAQIAVADIRDRLRKRVHEPGHVNLSQAFVKDDDGYNVSADAVVWGMTHGTGTTMQMLAEQNQWLDVATGEIVLPLPTPAVENSVAQAGALLVLALTWQDLMRGWERVRFFGGGYKVETVTLKVGDPPEDRAFDALQFGVPGPYELHDRIATARLGQNYFQYAAPMLFDRANQRELRKLDSVPIGLPSAGNFISAEELAAFGVLGEVMCLPVTADAEHAGGLSLKEWLRGYAFLAVAFADRPNEAESIFLQKADLQDGLASVGFSAAKAEAFIRQVSFGKKSRDLFDEPLVRLADGRYFLYGPALRAPNLANIVMSRLGSLRCNFKERGPRFEGAVVRAFRSAGLSAEGGFKYRVSGTEFECDAAVLWDERLFVFECKNYTLPFGHLPTLAHFRDAFHGAALQAKRTAEHFRKDPKLIPSKLASTGKWTKIVPCVLYALPWAMGKLLEEFEIYSIDGSALSRFLEDGRISLIAPRQHTDELTVQRRHHKKLWAGDRPTADDLLRQLERPAQSHLYVDAYQINALPRQVSATRLIAVPEWTEQERGAVDMIRALGIGPEEANQVAASFREFHAAADIALERAKIKSKPE